MKKKNVGIVAGLLAMKKRVFGMTIVPSLYGPPPSRLSGLENVLKMFQTILAPVLFLIGIIIYLRKSKDSKKRKVIMTIIYILLIVGVYYSIEFLLYRLSMVF